MALDKDTHKKITREFRELIPYDSIWKSKDDLMTSTAKPQQIWDTVREVYKKHGMTQYLEPLQQQLIKAGHKLDWGDW